MSTTSSILQDIHCSSCELSWPELDHETTRRCPTCGAWLDHVPFELREGEDREKPIFLAAGGDEASSRYLLIISGPGHEAAALLEEAGITVERLTEMPGHHQAPRGLDWKLLALWLASCFVATAEHEGRLKKTSKASAARWREICVMTADAIEGTAVSMSRRISASAVVKSLRKASEDPSGS